MVLVFSPRSVLGQKAWLARPHGRLPVTGSTASTDGRPGNGALRFGFSTSCWLLVTRAAEIELPWRADWS